MSRADRGIIRHSRDLRSDGDKDHNSRILRLFVLTVPLCSDSLPVRNSCIRHLCLEHDSADASASVKIWIGLI